MAGDATHARTDFFSIVTSPEYISDPYRFFRQLRAAAPALGTESGIWVVTRYADVAKALRDPALSCDFSSLDMPAAYFRARGVDKRYPMPLNAIDPPDHQRIRSAVSPPFVPHQVEKLRPLVEAAVEKALDRLEDRAGEDVDIVAELAYPVPITIIAAMFGIPDTDHKLLERWSRAFGSVSDPDPLLTDEQRADALGATSEAGDYFGRMLVARRRDPGADLMSSWLAAYREHKTMSIPELLVNGVFLLIVGHHNTVSLICNGLYALLNNPAELERLRKDPELALKAVDELLRYDSPVQTATRFTTEAGYRAGDVEIPPRRQVMLLLGSANRDEAAFDNPDQLDLGRAAARTHLGLSRGMHACIGGALVRLEVSITLSALLRRFPQIAQAGEISRPRPCFALRSMTSFPVILGRAAGAAAPPAQGAASQRVAASGSCPAISASSAPRLSSR